MDASRPEPQYTSTDLDSAYGKPVSLNLGRIVFFSHSGKDKDFVRRLNREVRKCYRGNEVTFFDEETLPKGKHISMEETIIEVARESALAVLVLTDDFFMHTRNPMLELEAFVAENVTLLPLFLKLSVEDFKEKKQWDRWEKKWKEWAAADDKLVIDKWRTSLKSVKRYDGLEFAKIAPDGREGLYIHEVVKQVARIIGPAVPFCGADVYGKVRLCQMVEHWYNWYIVNGCSPIDRAPTQIASTSANLGLVEDNGLYGFDLVGIYGFQGFGKTTLCKCLCDFYFRQLSGKVCYIDVGLSSEPRISRMQHVLTTFDWGNTMDVHNFQLDSNQLENLLKERLSSMKDPVFLAIDNILPETESREEVSLYLRCKFPKGSKILITSKTQENLTSLLPPIWSLLPITHYMPALEFEEARAIFVSGFPALIDHQGSNLPAVVEESVQRDVDACVNKCRLFTKWHPLMLKSLAAFVKWDELTPNLDWKGRLAKLASEGIIHKDDAWNEAFQVFNITYRLLGEAARKVFLDLALCNSSVQASVLDRVDLYEWIVMLHRAENFKESDMERILLGLHNLCFIEKKGREINIQDLMTEFGKHKAAAAPDGYVVEDGTHTSPLALPETTRHVSIARCRNASIRTLDLRDVKGVKVLHLVDNAGLEEVLLSCTSTAHLCSIIVSVPPCTALRCIMDEDWISQPVRCLKLRGNISFCSQPSQHSLVLPDARMDTGTILLLLGDFRNLELLTLDSLTSLNTSLQGIDLAPCVHLKTLRIKRMPGLKSIRVPESNSCLEEVEIERLPHLETLAFNVLADSKTRFCISYCESLQRVSLTYTTPSTSAYADPARSSHLNISHCPRLANLDGLSQYTGGLVYYSHPEDHEVQGYGLLQETFVRMVKDAGIDFSRCKAKVTGLNLGGYTPAAHCRLEAVKEVSLTDAQHIGPLISAMIQAKPTCLQWLRIQCQQQAGAGCGCDQNAPNFSTLAVQWVEYSCPQVRDLGSLAQLAPGLEKLYLLGCTSVEVWPDFAAMTSLITLDLSNTSLKGWPAGVQRLPCLKFMILKGCQQLPARELILGAITSDHQCSWSALDSLRGDLIDSTRDRRTVADALGALSAELGECFDRWLPTWGRNVKSEMLWVVLDIMYKVWFGGGGGDEDEQEEPHIRAGMRGLLVSESFRLLPFRVCRSFLSEKRDLKRDNKCGTGGIVVPGIALVGGASSAYSSYRALPVIDRRLRHNTIHFLMNTYRSLIQSLHPIPSKDEFFDTFEVNKDELHWLNWESTEEVLRERVEVGLRTMAREAGVIFYK